MPMVSITIFLLQFGASFEAIQSAETMALSGKRGVMTHVDDLLGQNLLTLSQSMRLLGLLSVCGLNDDFNAMLSQVLLCHGHKHLSTAHSLEMMGLHTDDTSAASIVGRVAQAVNRKSPSVQVMNT